MKDDFEAEDFCTVVFDEFFFTAITHDNFVRHLLRLLYFVYPKLSNTRNENLLKLTEPASSGSSSSSRGLPADPISALHAELREKVKVHIEDVEQRQMDEENRKEPLM